MVRDLSPPSSISFIGTADDALIHFTFRSHMCAVHGTLAALKDANTFNQNLSKDPQPVDFTGSTNLFQKSINCALNTTPPISASASVSLDAGANVHATIGMSAVAAGTFVPPTLSQFGLNFGAYSN